MKNLQMINLKSGSEYSRNDLHYLYFNKPLPKKGTGNWTNVHVIPKNTNDFLVFLNIGVAGKTGHNFENKYDHDEKILEWYGKPYSHSNQPTYIKLFSEELTPHFFARWAPNKINFLYLGTGSIIEYEDNVKTIHGPAIKLRYLIHELSKKEENQLLNLGVQL